MLSANIIPDMLCIMLIAVLCLPQTFSVNLGKSQTLLRQQFYNAQNRINAKQTIAYGLNQEVTSQPSSPTLSLKLGRSLHIPQALLRQRFYNAQKRSRVQHKVAKDMKQGPLDTSALQPWSCGCNYFWRDLGDAFYPRYVQDGRCKTKSCWYGHYSCVPFKYQLKVLKRLHPLDDVDNGYRHSLGDDYTFVNVNVTVNCECRHDVLDHERVRKINDKKG